ncbi:4'-phosphopantetheinyl transferase superfamily protein [Clostridium sporogenes]|uniref:4'-phosphopantetheinyl transferase family protein n=1 Tax=Clostridium sp. LCP25S3_F8 TaxID=3438751 RepID=UPI0013D254ED|nr:4'-phosphopantetheinyl transferase superfamily protein [Clostridium sporogenes]NFS25992.1 4'-phosphopantetheinyl transferase superfamily protein [Clostridium sporogenes]
MEIYMVKILDISEKKLNFICSLIDTQKRQVIEKFINKKDKIRSLVGEILVRTIIAQKLNISNGNIIFGKNQYGKPYLIDYPKFKFNISHSGSFVVCAIDSKSIGIDIEEVRNIEYEDIVKNFFSVSEFKYIIKQDVNCQLSKFYEMWVLKESYIKCCGQGLSIPLKSFSIDIEKYENIKVTINNEYKKHKFKIFDIDLGYKMAVCSLNNKISDNVISINQNTLINDYCKLALEG